MLRRGREPLFLTVVEVEFDEASDERTSRQYLLPLAVASAESAKATQERFPYAVLARISGARKGLLIDGWHDDRLADVLLEAVTSGATIATRARAVRAAQTGVFPQLRRALRYAAAGPAVRGCRRGVDQLRQPAHVQAVSAALEPGTHPEVEATRHLAAAGFSRVPRRRRHLDYDAEARRAAQLTGRARWR